MSIQLNNKLHCPVCDERLHFRIRARRRGAARRLFTVCDYCRTFLRFDRNLELVELTPAEIGALEDEARNALLPKIRAEKR